MRFLLALLLLLAPLSIQAECNRSNSINWTEDDALVEYLNSCKRPPLMEERWLYTWGHKEKLRLLQQIAPNNFMQYNRAQQFAFANAKARAGKEDFLTYPLFPNYLKRVKGSIGTATIDDLYQYSNDNSMLKTLEHQWQQITRDGAIPVPKALTKSQAATTALEVLALNQMHPGFIADMHLNTQEQLTQAEKTLEKGSLSRPKELLIKGRILGLQRAKNPQSSGDKKPSNISFGVANYLAETPGAFAEHFYGEGYGGLRCKLDTKLEITDLSTSSAFLRKKGVFLSKADGSGVQYPSGYNEVANPPRFNQATLGRLIQVKTLPNIYADTGAINYQRKGICQPITLRDFTHCNAVTQLLRKTDFPAGQSGSELYKFLAPDDTDNQYFLNKVRGCAISKGLVNNRQDSRLPALPNSCSALTDRGFRGGGYFRDNRETLEKIVTEICNKE